MNLVEIIAIIGCLLIVVIAFYFTKLSNSIDRLSQTVLNKKITFGREAHYLIDSISSSIRVSRHYDEKLNENLIIAINGLNKKELPPKEPLTKEDATQLINEFAKEDFKIYAELQCIGNDKKQWMNDELEYNRTLIKKYRELGFGYSIQVRRHYIKVIKDALKDLEDL